MIATATINSTLGLVHIGLLAGEVTLIAGPNGVGKSALIYEMYRAIPQGQATYLPGHRQINFNAGIEQIAQDTAQLQLNIYNAFDNFNRHKGAWSEDQFKSTIRTLLNLEAAFNREFRINISAKSKKYAKKISPLDTLNLIFSNSGFAVSFSLTGIGLTANRGDSAYSPDALSDGERAALFIAAAFIAQPTNTVLLIDEPEKHLHPSITGLLLETALRARKDIGVVICSHDIHLVEKVRANAILHVRDSKILTPRPETRVYTVDPVSNESFPEALKADVLGSRSAIIFIEGTEKSRDAALYGQVYPDQKVITKGGADKVMEAVGGLYGSEGLHWLAVCGLIDKDGRRATEINVLEKRHIFTLPVPTIENLFFVDEVQRCFVDADLAMHGGKTWSTRSRELQATLKKEIPAARDEIVARRVCWAAQREISSNPLSVKDVRDRSVTELVVKLQPIIDCVEAEIDAILISNDVQRMLLELPIKNTDIPSLASRALGASSFNTYCAVVLHQIETESPFGLRALKSLQNILPTLTQATPKVDEVPIENGRRWVGITPAAL